MRRRVCELIRKGVPRMRAARLAGIGESTFCRWMRDGEAGERRIYREFRQSVCRAEDELVERAVSSITDLFDPESNAEPNTRLNAAKFVLTHRFNGEFSARQEVTGKGGEAVQVQAEVAVRPVFSDDQLREMTPEQLEAALGVLVGRGAAGGGGTGA
jgi:hypothetical protein